MRTALAVSLACIGLAALAAPFFLPASSTARPTGPGRLVPEREVIEWRGTVGDEAPAAGPQARATFRVVNRGGAPVRIESVRSSCECATPRFDPEVVPPGGAAVVEVQATPPATGERTATIELLTDSEATPEVLLRLRMVGGRRPPYLERAGGDLTYLGAWSPAETRTITAVTVEPREGEHPLPSVESDLPFLGIELENVEERRMSDPSIIARVHTFRVTFASGPPGGRFAGEVAVIDPWEPSRRERIHVVGETPEPIAVIPPRLVLRRGQDDAEAVLRVLVRDPSLAPTAEPEDGDAGPLRIQPLPSDDGRVIAFRVEVAPGTGPEETISSVIVRPSPSSGERIVVPVLIAGEERP